MNKLFKYFSLFFLLMVCNYTNVQAIDINGNILKNGDFTQKDTTIDRRYMPSDWNINQVYDLPPKSTSIDNSANGLNHGVGSYGPFYWKYSNPTGITVQDASSLNVAFSVVQQVDKADVTLDEHIIIGGTVDLTPSPLVSNTAYSSDLTIRLVAGQRIGAGDEIISKRLSDPDVEYDSNTGRFITEFRPNEIQKAAYASHGITVWFIGASSTDPDGNKVQPIMSLDNLFFVQQSLDVSTTEMKVPLGSEISTNMVKKHITNVSILGNGEDSDLDSYRVDNVITSNSIATDSVGIGETVVNITGIKNGKEIKGVASIPTEVTWGNDISLGGFTNTANESTLALSLINEGNNAKIVGTYGDNTKHDRQIHSSFLDADYYQIDYFPRGTSSPLNLTNDLTKKGTKSLTLKGKQTPADAVKGWGTQVAKEGDIIRVWMKEPKINWYQNGDRQNQLSDFPNRNLIYFEVTEDGFKPLYNNQVKGKTNIPINQGTSEDTLNSRYRDNPKGLLDIPEQEIYKSIQYSMDKFEQYPDTKTVGKNKTSKVIMTGQTENTFGKLNITFDVNPTFDVVEQQAINWLPSYSKWKNSNTDTIPKESAFVMMYSDNTEVVEYSEGIQMQEALENKKNLVEFDPTKGPQWIRWSNVGYYKGQNIGVKMIVTPDPTQPGPRSPLNLIGFRRTDFLRVDMDRRMGFLDVEYEFLDEQGKPIEVSGYWTLNNVSDSKTIALRTDLLDNIYSIPTGGNNPILISYDLKGNMIEITGNGHFASGSIPTEPTNLIASQLQTTVSYKNQKSFSYVISSTPKNPFSNSSVAYVSSSIAKVEIPDPQPVNQTVEKITEDNRDKLTNEFVQQIPYESSLNRNQKMTWTVSNIKNDDVFKTGVWQVYDETGKEQTGLFEFAEDNKTIKPKDLSNSNLYNHYYRFFYSLPFNDKGEVDENQLITKDGGKYLPYSQDISLKVDSLSPVVATPTTDINFMATINYSYTDEEGKPITMDGLAKTGTSLITKPYPVTKAPEIKGYTFNKSEPSDLTNEKILYTDNTVTFIYDKINKVQMTVNYYQLDRQGNETDHRVIGDLKTGKTVNALVKEVEVGEKISDFIPQSDFDNYIYKSSIVTNDVTNETIEDDIVPMDDFTVNRYYQPLENLSVPKTISFGEKNAQRLKDEYSVKNSPSPINLTSGYSDVNWSLHASSDGLFSEGTNTRLLSDMYFRLNNEKMIINKEDTILASQINKHYYDLPLVTEDNKEGLFLEIGNSGTKDSKYSGKIKFSMVTGP